MTVKRVFKYLLGAILLTVLVGLGLLFWGLYSLDNLPIPATKENLRIVSMNVSAGNELSSSLQKELIASRPDIIVIIEWTGNNINLADFTSAGYTTALNHPRKRVHGLCILSQLPGQATVIEAPIVTPCTLPLGQFRFKWEGKSISLFAMHAPPPVPACKGTTGDYLVAVSDWLDNGTLNKDIGIGKRGDFTIIAGDFNSISIDKGINSIKGKGLNDSYSKYNLTAQTWKPFKRFPYVAKIDYILFADKFKSVGAYRFNIDNSDHLGLLTDMKFSTQN